MRTLKIARAPADPPPAGPLYHRSGALLLPEGKTLTEAVRQRMAMAGILEVIALDAGDDPERLRLEMLAKKVSLADVPDGTAIRAELRNSQGKLIVPPRTALSTEVRALLEREGIKGFYVRRSPAEMGLDEVELFRALGAEGSGPRQDVALPTFSTPRVAQRSDLSETRVRTWVDAPSGTTDAPLSESVSTAWRAVARPPEHREGCLRTYAQLLAETRALYGRLANVSHEPWGTVESIARRIVASLVRDRELIVNLVNLKARGEYLPSHSLHMAILSAAIGITAGVGGAEAMELAVAGLLARAGMLRVPEAIREKTGPLTTEEIAEVRRAPSLGIQVIKKVDRMPVRVAIASYQCMERVDGSGYPQGLTGERIHKLSRIVSIADVYDALLADRPWRPALLPYKAMEVILLLVDEGRLDREVTRQFQDTVSLFPLGSWVELSDGRLGRVVAANGSEHIRPIVAALYGRDAKPLAAPERVDLAARRDISVACPVDGEDLAVSTVEGW